MSFVILESCNQIFQNQTLSDVESSMVRNHNIVSPIRQEPRENKLCNGVDMTTLPKDAASSYGRNVARVLLTCLELINGIGSPEKDMTFMDCPKKPRTPVPKRYTRG